MPKHELTVFLNDDRFLRLKKITDQADLLPDDLANRVLNLAIDLLNVEAIYVAASMATEGELKRQTAKLISLNSRL